LWPVVKEFCISSEDFRQKVPNIKFHLYSSIGSRADKNRRTGMTKLVGVFRKIWHVSTISLERISVLVPCFLVVRFRSVTFNRATNTLVENGFLDAPQTRSWNMGLFRRATLVAPQISSFKMVRDIRATFSRATNTLVQNGSC